MKTPKMYWLIYDVKNQKNLGWTDKKPASHIEGDALKIITTIDSNEHVQMMASIKQKLNFCPMDFYDTGINPDQAEEICAIIAKRLK